MEPQAQGADRSPAKPRRSALVEAAVSALTRAGRPLPVEHLVRVVMQVEFGALGPASRALEPLLVSDERLQRVDAGHWGLCAWTQRELPVCDIEFVVFDVETNGGRGGRHRVLEIGAERVRDGRVLARFESLVRIPQRISRFITRYTGITDEMIEDAPGIEPVLSEFREFQSGAVLVAHNLPTDLGYLNREAVWARQPLFPGDGLDTMELVEALMPEVDGSGLEVVLKAAGVAAPARHRALPDAQATARLFEVLLTRAAARGPATLESLHEAAQAGGPEGPMPRRARELARWTSRNLPPTPGVYVFRSKSGQALYVGKAVSLQRRARSHFTDSAGFVRKRDGLLERVDRIDWEATGSELLALLREAELIDQLEPSYNVHRQRRSGRRFVRIGPPKAAVTHTAREVSENADADDVGPFRTSRDAQLASAAARRVFELPSRRSADKSVAPWRRAAALTFLSGGRQAAAETVKEADASTGERDLVLRRLRRLRVERRPVRGGLGGGRVVVADPGETPGSVVILLIDAGQIEATEVLYRPRRSDVRRALTELLARAPGSEKASDTHRNIVLAWLHAAAGRADLISADAPAPDARLLEQVWRQVRRAARE